MNLFESLKRRFKNKECCHICLWCDFRHDCDISPYDDIKHHQTYKAGFEAGYKRGYIDGYKERQHKIYK